MKARRTPLNLKVLKDPGLRLRENNACEGRLELAESHYRLLLEPEGLLYMEGEVNGMIDLSCDFLMDILHLNSTLTRPVKFTLVKNGSLRLNLRGELPAATEAALQEGFASLKEGFTQARKNLKKGMKNRNLRRESKRASTKEKSEMPSEIVRTVEPLLKKHYEYSERADGWIIYFRPGKEFHKINVRFDEKTGLLRVETTLAEIAAGQADSQISIAAFLLHSTGRLRFVKAVAGDKNGSGEVGMGIESSIPLDLLDHFPPQKAIESVLTASRFTRAPCEALLNKELADAYLNWVRETGPGKV
jgi:hypothetical protein